MTREDAAVRRARRALEGAAGDEMAAHPGVEALEAYVEGRLPAPARAEIERLAAQSSIVAEDLADLQSVHEALGSRPVVRQGTRWAGIAAAAGIAATLGLGVWATMRSTPPPVEQDQAAATGLTGSEQARVDAATRAGRIELSPETVRLMHREGTLLGTEAPQAPFAPLAPLGTGIDTLRPTFRWSNAGAASYTVAVFDESFTAVAESPRVGGTSWMPEVELPPGRVYVWQVTAHTSAGEQTEPRPPRPEARFMIIDAAAAATVRAQRARLAGEPLALGILLAEAGLLDEARAELTRAANAPATADFARRLLASLANYK